MGHDQVNDAYIYIGQYTGRTLPSQIIAVFTWSRDRRSHTSAFFPPVDGEFDEVIEAWRKGVRRNHWTEHHAPGTIIDVYRVPCTREQAALFYTYMIMKVGSKYDFLGVLSFLFRRRMQRDGRWFCSEAVFDSACKAGIKLLSNIEPWRVSPALMDLPPQLEFVERLEIPGK